MRRAAFLTVLLPVFCCLPAAAGGAWVPERGAGDVIFGYSNKTADTSWNPRGDTRYHSSLHDFRYLYQGGEVGLGRELSFRYLVLFLDGYEGRPGDLEHNAGMSELYLGMKYRLRGGDWPMALGLDVRTSYLYDLPGPYDRHLFLADEDDIDGDGDTEEAVFKGVSPEWRGLLGEDIGLSFLVSRLVFETGWLNLSAGYRYRTTNLANEIPLFAELGYPLPWQALFLKGTLTWIESVGNDSPERQPNDRFGCSERNCFPDSSYAVLGASLIRHFGGRAQWWWEAGFNQWVWGRSARKYEEPFVSIGRRF
jgi:hypothetical protein